MARQPRPSMRRASPSGRRALADRHDAVVLDHQVPVAMLGPGGVDRGDRAALDDGPHSALGRQPDGVEDLLVARAAAEVAGQRLADLGIGGVRVARQQVVAGDDQPRRAEAALHRARLDEGLLDGVQLARPPPGPSTVTTSRPSACPASTRHAHTSSPSR